METKKTLNEKLLEFQNSIEVIKKDGKNSFFKKPDGKASTYATLPNILAEVKPIINALKLVVTQPIQEGKVFTVITCTESGDAVHSSIDLPSGVNPQNLGSAITYFRRYTLTSLLALEIDEDDDGNAASQTNDKAEVKEDKAWLNKYSDKAKTKTTDLWEKVAKAVASGTRTIAQVESAYKLSKELKEELIKIQQVGI